MPQGLSNRWFPNTKQLKSTADVEKVIRQVLKQHYELVNKVETLAATPAPVPAPAPIPNGPTNTQILGLNVMPVDVGTLTDGAKLQWSKKDGAFKFV